MFPLRRRPFRFVPALAVAAVAIASQGARAGHQCFCFGDLNLDGAVNAADLAIVLSGWGSGGESDLNGSGSTDGADLALILAQWGPCNPPANDECSNAQELDSVPSFGVYTCNIGATDSSSTQFASCGNDGATNIHKDVWYTYVPPQSGVFVVSTCAALTDFDTVIAVYTAAGGVGCACPAALGSPIACDDDTCALASEVTVPCIAGKCYMIRVGSYGDDPGAMVLGVVNNP
jgi:hypothetical protein